MKKDMPLEGLRWSRDSGSALYDTPQTAVLGRAVGGHILRLCQPLVWLSKYSFGIYIFHNWVGPYMISSTAKRIFLLEDLAANHVVLFPLMLTLSVICISWCLSWALMQTKVGRILIG